MNTRGMLPFALALAPLLLSLSAVQPATAASWVTTGLLNTSRTEHTATLLPNGTVLVAGGNGNVSSAELYNPATGEWTATGSLTAARVWHTATLLPNGKLLIAGGYRTNDLSSAELYDPVTGTWTTTGAMNTARSYHTATLLLNGKVLVAGGTGSGHDLSSAELYDPTTGTWTAAGNLTSARLWHTATLLPNGKVLVTGGAASDFDSGAELYDPATGTWTTTGAMITARWLHTATLLPNGKVLVAGGAGSGNYLSSTELYEPATGTWTTTGAMSNARDGHTAALLPNGKVLVGGGWNESGTLPSAELYDPVAGTWTTAGAMNIARGDHTATLLPNGRVLVAGGYGSGGSYLSSAELYDSASGAWAATNAMNNAREQHTATLLPNGKVLVAGGFGNGFSGFLSNAELYDPASGMWTATGSLAIARCGHTATLLPNGKALVAGGYNGIADVSSAELYDPATGTWAATGSMTAARAVHTSSLLANGKVLVAGGGNASAELYDPAAGTWTATGTLNTARQWHTATLLPNGKVLVAGGEGNRGGILSSAELYDPASGAWTATGAMNTPRFHHTATLLPNGKVLVAAGFAPADVTTTAELYDSANGTWTLTGVLTTARYQHTATLLPNGKVLVAGGSLAGIDPLSSVELYDPSTKTWTAAGLLATSRTLHTAILLPSGNVLVAGGDGSSGGTLSSAELYDVGLGFSASWQPQIATVTSPPGFGGSIVLTGSGFRGISEGSGGNTQDSPGDYPVVQLRSVESGQTLFLPSAAGTNWSTNSFTSAPVNGFPLGYALVTVFVNGTPSAATVAALTPPVITAQPQNLTTNGGTTVSFSVTVAGTQPLYFQWMFDGVNLAGQNNSTLTLSAVQASQAGIYSVVVWNALGTNLFSARLCLPGAATYHYDRNDRLLGVEYGTGMYIGYAYDGNGNMIRQVYGSLYAQTNGLPEFWRFLNGLSTTDNTGTNGIYADADSDGWSNYQEWIAGTDPLDPDSQPSLFGLAGTNLAALSLQFTPSNFVVGTGPLGSLGEPAIVVGADGNPGTNTNFLLVLSETSSGWTTQKVNIGAFGVTSVAVGQPTNRPGPAIYVGLRQTGGTGQVAEISLSGGNWVLSPMAYSTNSAAFVLGVRPGNDVLASLATTNAADGALYSLSFSANVWKISLLDTGTSHRGLGTVTLLPGSQQQGSELRLLDSGGIQLSYPSPPPFAQAVYCPYSQLWYFPTPTQMTWANAQSYAQSAGGNLATVTNATLDAWLTSQFFGTLGQFWIGLSRPNCCQPYETCGWTWASGAPFGSYTNWAPTQPDCQGGNELFGQIYTADGKWNDNNPNTTLYGVAEVGGSGPLVIGEPATTSTATWRGCSLASGPLRAAATNACSLLFAFTDDKNTNGWVGVGDDFVIAEYLLNGTNVTATNVFRQPITVTPATGSYGLAAVNYLNGTNDVLFTAEPDGQIFSWIATNANGPLQRQLFSSQNVGKAWHALAAVGTLEPGEGLVGLCVDPASPSNCTVAFWPPQPQLWVQPSIPQTAPVVAVLPQTDIVGVLVPVLTRLWNAVGGSTIPYLQYEVPGSTNWRDAAITKADGAPYTYSFSNRVAALPSGSDHVLTWNASVVFTNTSLTAQTNVLLRVRAQSVTATGDWSAAVNYTLVGDADGNGLPDWWEIQYFGTNGVNPNVDPDGDGFSNMQEYIADTNPLDRNSYLRITSAQVDTNGVHIYWSGGIQARQYVQRRPVLSATNVWVNMATYQPPTSSNGAYSQALGTNSAGFYRIRVERP